MMVPGPVRSPASLSIGGRRMLAGSICLLLAGAFYAQPAFALSCEDLSALLKAGTPLAIIAETVRVASPQPTRTDMECLEARGVDISAVRLFSDAAGLPPGEQVAVASMPPVGASDPRAVRVRVTGMDADHALKASAAGPTFRQRVTTFRRDVCPSLDRVEFGVDVQYGGEGKGTSVAVNVVGLPTMPVRPYPGGRMMAVNCTSIVAAAACTSWNVSQVLILQDLPGDDLLFGYGCDAYGAEPVALGIAGGERLVQVPIYRPSAWEVLLEFPKTLPDGTPNGTAQLIRVVGEAGLP